MDFHVILTIGEYAFKRIMTGWFIKLLGGAAVFILILIFMGGPEPQKDFLDHKAFALDIIGVVGMIMVTVMGATEIPRDVDTQTILILLSKPVSKDDVVVGKFVGLVYVAVFTILSLSLVCMLGCLVQGYMVQADMAATAEFEGGGKPESDKPGAITKKTQGKKGRNNTKQSKGKSGDNNGLKSPAEEDENAALAFDPDRFLALGGIPDVNFIQKVLFRVFQCIVVAAAVILLSTKLGEIPIIGFITMYTSVGFFIFYLRAIIEIRLVPGAAQIPLYLLYYAFPNLKYLQVPPETTNLGTVSWSHFVLAAIYSLCYAAVLLLFSMKSFRGREVAG